MAAEFAGFFSYSVFDDHHHGGLLSAIRAFLGGEVRSLTPIDFELFQDIEDIHPGEVWRHRLKDAVEAATVFLPVVTPQFLRSEWCRQEVQDFLRRQEELGRHDLIMPLHFTSVEALARDRPSEEMASVLFARQVVDVTRFRQDEVSTRELRVALVPLAQRIAVVAPDRRDDPSLPASRDGAGGRTAPGMTTPLPSQAAEQSTRLDQAGLARLLAELYPEYPPAEGDSPYQRLLN